MLTRVVVVSALDAEVGALQCQIQRELDCTANAVQHACLQMFSPDAISLDTA